MGPSFTCWFEGHRARPLRLALAGALLLAPVLQGQTEASEYAEGAAYLTIAVTEAGAIDVSLDIPHELPPDSPLVTALADTFGCTPDDLYLENSEDTEASGLWVSGWCEGKVVRDGLLVRANLELGELRRQLQEAGVDSVLLTLNHAATDYYEPPRGFDSSTDYGYEISHSLTAPVGQWPDQVSVEFGYRLQDLARLAGVILIVSMAPLLWVLWLRRLAVRAGDNHRPSMWFAFWRYFKHTDTLAWLLLVPACHYVGFSRFTAFLWNAVGVADYGETAYYSVWLLSSYTPPFLLSAACVASAHPLLSRMSGGRWSAGDFWRRAALRQAVWAVPLVCVLAGLTAVTAEAQLQPLAPWLGAAVLSFWVIRKLASMAEDPASFELKFGSLHERIQALAKRENFPLRRVYLVPVGKSLFEKTLKVTRQDLFVSEDLLRTLNQPEVDALIADEFRYEKRRPPSIGSKIWFTGVVVLASVVPLIVDRLVPEQYTTLISLIIVFLVILAVYLGYVRRVASAVDGKLPAEEAAQLIRGCAKLVPVYVSPSEWPASGRAGVTSQGRDVLDRIGQLKGIDKERIAAILAEPGSKDYYDFAPSGVSPLA